MCNKTMKEGLYNLEYVPEKCKTKEMHVEIVEEDPYAKKIPDKHMTQEICNNVVREDRLLLEFVPVHLDTQEMCIGTIKKYPWSFIHVPDLYVRLHEIWYGYY